MERSKEETINYYDLILSGYKLNKQKYKYIMREYLSTTVHYHIYNEVISDMLDYNLNCIELLYYIDTYFHETTTVDMLIYKILSQLDNRHIFSLSKNTDTFSPNNSVTCNLAKVIASVMTPGNFVKKEFLTRLYKIDNDILKYIDTRNNYALFKKYVDDNYSQFLVTYILFEDINHRNSNINGVYLLRHIISKDYLQPLPTGFARDVIAKRPDLITYYVNYCTRYGRPLSQIDDANIPPANLNKYNTHRYLAGSVTG